MKVGITGANGHLGKRLIGELVGSHELCAVVRSESARQKLLSLYPRNPRIKICIANYSDAEQIAGVLADCEVVIHLVGIIKESNSSSFEEAHESSCGALIAAAEMAGIKRIVYLSIAGTDVRSDNRCLSSKARAEVLFKQSNIGTLTIKVPMVLGEGDFASRSLKRNASRNFPVTFRAGSLEQPIYAGDVIRALTAAIDIDIESESGGASSTICLAGPESITRRLLIHRAARVLGTSPRVVSLPLMSGIMFAWLLEHLPDPPMSRDMLGVLDHDDQIDVSRGCARLHLTLTSLDDMLQKVLKPV